MRLRIRTQSILTIALVNAIVMLGIYFQFALVISDDYAKTEAQHLSLQLKRIHSAVESRIERLLGVTSDWADWDDSYRFIEKPDPSFATNNISTDFLKSIHVNHLVYLDQQGRTIRGFTPNFSSRMVNDIDPSVARYLTADSPFTRVTEGKPYTGFIDTPSHLLLVAAVAVQDSALRKPMNGILIFAEEVTPDWIQRLGQQAHVDLEVINVQKEPLTSKVEEILHKLKSSSENQVIDPISEKIVEAYTLQRNGNGEPNILFKLTEPRTIYGQWYATRKKAMTALLFGTLLMTAFSLAILQRTLISRLKSISAQIRTIAINGDSKSRVALTGGDELKELSDDVNRMLLALQEAREKAIGYEAEALSSRERSDFVAKVSHELRTPLHNILGMLRLIARTQPSTSNNRHLQIARESADGLLALINDILDFSSFQNGVPTLATVDFSLREVVRDIINRFGPKVYEKTGLDLWADVDSTVPLMVHGDPLRVSQIFSHLLSNCVKFTHRGRIEVTVRLGGRENEIVIGVADSGVGIPSHRMEAIFKPFTQADNSVSRRFDGAGLGLTLTKQLVEAMDGTLSVKSAENQGTIVSLSIILKALPSKHLIEATLSPKDVVLFGPVTSLRTAAQSYLKSKNLQVLAFDSLDREMLGQADERHLVIDGLLANRLDDTTLHHLSSAYDRSCVLFLLNPGDISIEQKLSTYGFAKFLFKPVLLEQLFSSMVSSDQKPLTANVAASPKNRPVIPLRVLVAEDAPLNQVIIRGLLEDRGYRVVMVEDGEKLLQALTESLELRGKQNGSEGNYDLIITDVQMPNMDGITATRLIRQKEGESQVAEERRIPIIALTARAMKNELGAMTAAGVNRIVTKPLNPDELWEAIDATVVVDDTHVVDMPEKVTETKSNEAYDVILLSRRITNDFVLNLDPQLRYKRERRFAEYTEREDPSSRVSDFTSFMFYADPVWQRAGRNMRRLYTIIECYNQSYGELLDRVHISHQKGDVANLSIALHTLKGLTSQTGCCAGAFVALLMEDAIARADRRQFEDLLPEFDGIIEAFSDLLVIFLSQLAETRILPVMERLFASKE